MFFAIANYFSEQLAGREGSGHHLISIDWVDYVDQKVNLNEVNIGMAGGGLSSS